MSKVSVIVPCYNMGQYLTEAVESVIAQTYTNWEIVIVNDGSTDNTAIVANTFMSIDPRIRMVWQPNQGLAAARNTGIAEANGEYILPLDADDAIRSTLLEKAVNILDTRPDIHIVGFDCQRFGTANTFYTTTDDLAAPNHLVSNNMNYCSMYRKKVWEAVGGYSSEVVTYEDWDFWLSCIPHGFKLYRIPELLFQYRIRPDSKLVHDTEHFDNQARAQIRERHGLP